MIECNFGHKYMKFHSLAEVGYNQAVQYYNQQKKNFISWLDKQSSQEHQQFTNSFIQSVNEEIIKQFNTQPLNSAQTKIFDTLAQRIVKYLDSNPRSGAMRKDVHSALSTIKLKGRGLAEVSGKDMADKIKGTLQQIVEQGEMQELMDQAFKDILQKNLSALSPGQLQMAYGYARRIIYNYFKPHRAQYQAASVSGKSLSGYINAFSGLFKEEVIEASVNQLCQENNIEGVSAQRIGDQLVDNKESRTDILIGLFGQNVKESAIKINQLDNFLTKLDQISSINGTTLEVNLFDPDNFIGAGIQSKSWPSPDFVHENNSDPTKKQLRPFFSIGNRADFYAFASTRSGDKFGVYSWHYNVYALSKKIVPILGAANILYSTRDGMFWTAQLIEQFTKYNYYLSYYFTRSKGTFTRPATKEITWQQEVSADNFKGFNDI